MSRDIKNKEEHININLIGKTLKQQLEELEQQIQVATTGVDIWIETNEENLISIAPLKAMNAKLKCAISKNNKDIWSLKLMKNSKGA
tara:strand:+ start:4337 stop:4597 length:261 start_codon:yes stop_codon:yes gene_type:complete